MINFSTSLTFLLILGVEEVVTQEVVSSSNHLHDVTVYYSSTCNTFNLCSQGQVLTSQIFQFIASTIGYYRETEQDKTINPSIHIQLFYSLVILSTFGSKKGEVVTQDVIHFLIFLEDDRVMTTQFSTSESSLTSQIFLFLGLQPAHLQSRRRRLILLYVFNISILIISTFRQEQEK